MTTDPTVANDIEATSVVTTDTLTDSNTDTTTSDTEAQQHTQQTNNDSNTNNTSNNASNEEAEAEPEWDTHEEAVAQFQMLAAPNIGEYAGGADIKIGCPTLVMKLPSHRIPAHIYKQLPAHINRCIEANNRLSQNEKIARLPSKLYTLSDLESSSMTKTCHFAIHSHVPLVDGLTFNLMYHGWLFKDIVTDSSRLGCSLYPLIGIFDSVGMIDPEIRQMQQMQQQSNAIFNLQQFAGYDGLRWSDQHCHLDFGSWHIGSDMSKIIVDANNSGLSKFIVVCCDLAHQKIDVSLVYIISPVHVSAVEGMLRNCDPHQNAQKCKEFCALFRVYFMEEFNKHENEERLLQQMLFGNNATVPQTVQVPQEIQPTKQDTDSNVNNNNNENQEDQANV